MRFSPILHGFFSPLSGEAPHEAGADTLAAPMRRRLGAAQALASASPHATGEAHRNRKHAEEWSIELRPLVACKPLAGEWRALMARAIEASVFAGPEAMIAAAQHLPAAQPPMALVVRSSRRLIAIIPLASGRSPMLPGAIHGYMTPFQPVGVPLVDAQHFDAAMLCVANWFKPQAMQENGGAVRYLGPAGIAWRKLPLQGPFYAAIQRFSAREGLSLHVLEPYARPALPRSQQESRQENTQENEPPASARHRQNLRRLARRLEDLGPVNVREASCGEALNDALETLLAFEAMGWKGDAGTAIAQDVRTSCFIRSLVRQLGRSGEATVFTLASGERPVASALVLGAKGRYFCFKIAHCPEFARYSPGMLLAQAVGDLLAERKDFRLADSCADDDHSFMRRLWSDEITIGDVIMELPGATKGAVRSMLWRENIARRIRHQAKAAYHRLAAG